MKKKRNIMALLLSMLLLCASLAACGGETQQPQQNEPNNSEQPTSPANNEGANNLSVDGVVLLLPGVISDMGYNYGAYLGLQEIGNMGYRVDYTESIAEADCEDMLRAFAEQDYELIMGHGYQFSEPAYKIALENPNKYFFCYGVAPCEDEKIPDNACYLVANEYEAAYVCGAIAAMESESRVVGIVTGAPAAVQVGNINGFREGARSVDPDITVMDIMTGTFFDPATGKEAALSMIEQGCDVILHTCDATGTGVIDACVEKNVKVIGYGGDQSELAPDQILTSIIVNSTAGFSRQIERIQEGVFGGTDKCGFSTGIVQLAPYSDLLSEETKAYADKLVEDIISGAVVPTENLVSY